MNEREEKHTKIGFSIDRGTIRKIMTESHGMKCEI